MALTLTSSALVLPLPAKTLAEFVASDSSIDAEVKSSTAPSTRAPSPDRSSTTQGAAPLEDVEFSSAGLSDVESDSEDEDAAAFIRSVRKFALKNSQPSCQFTARASAGVLQAKQHNSVVDSESDDEEEALAFRAAVRRWMARPGATQPTDC
mmetsp:Transcript_49182/g.117119  ORF Transcript_49182/g.117119 Transcript_49182/m.117119 type:complete len:152 (+) Transcript_49182:100-555(+)